MDTHINGKSSAKAMNADAVRRGWTENVMLLICGTRELMITNLEYNRLMSDRR